MRYFQFSIILVLAAFALNACVDPDTTNLEIAGMFSGSSPRIKERFAQSQEYNNQHGFATIQAPVDHYNVYVDTDTHVRKTTRNIETLPICETIRLRHLLFTWGMSSTHKPIGRE